jgi:hypothetical protein
MNLLTAGRFEPLRRCLAVVDGKSYFGEVFNGQQRIFVDPEHPALRPQTQWGYTTGSTTSAGNVAYSFVQWR